ncbi:MAG: type II secretion system secretin GspD [Myxococcales bacterium]|nr:type II secretion system secretin GspD [Myxococcales bacterium]
MSTRLHPRTPGLAVRGLAAFASLAAALAPLPVLAAPATDDPTGARGASASRGGALIGDEGGGGPIPFNTCKKMGKKAKFTVTLPRETELDDLINWMMSITCQKFVLDRKVRSGKVTILSPEPVTVAEAYAAFYAALELMGLTVEPSGDYFKIVETAEAKNRSLPLYGDDANAPGSDRFVTQLVRVKHGNPKEISDLLSNLKSKNGSVDTIGNLIIITDKGTSVRRLLRLVDELDKPGNGEKIFFYQLQYADVNEVAEIIRDIFGQQGAGATSGGKGGKKATASGGAGGSRVLVDERTSTLIIVTSEGEYVMIRRLLEQLDVKLPGGGGRIHVKKLKNADADEVAQVLSNLATGAKAAADAKGSAKAGNKGAAATASAELFSGDVKITPDKATRSLVIIASQADYQNLEGVIDQLDSERKQLYFEIYLLEVTIKRSITGGAGGHFGAPFNVTGSDGTTQQAIGMVTSAPNAAVNSLLLSPEALSGFAAAILGPRVAGSGTLLGIGNDIPAFGVVIQALQTSEDVNIISEPHMYAADNQEATIEVGRNVPTPGALSFNSGGGQSLVPLQSVERQDVTLRIKVKPYINDTQTVTMDVEIEDRDIAGQDPVLGVTTTKRRLKLDKIVGRDDQPVVLGGLIRDREGENVQQVPGLGSIPLLGWLFKRKQKTKEKVNLLVVMIPHILESPDDVRRIHIRRDRERLEFLERETNFKRREIPRNVNFRKKSGVLATIDREARRIEQEEALLRKAEEEMRLEIITGEIGLSPTRGGDDGEADVGVMQAAEAPKPAVRPRAGGNN